MNGETNLQTLLHSMQPIQNEGVFVFCTLKSAPGELDQVLLLFREAEGITVIVNKDFADQKGYDYQSTFAWLTLQVHSALEAVGLTAAFAQALTLENISCNVVAGFYHDHIFVPHTQAENAMRTLQKLAQSAPIPPSPFHK